MKQQPVCGCRFRRQIAQVVRHFYAQLYEAAMRAFAAENEARMMAMGAARTNIESKLQCLAPPLPDHSDLVAAPNRHLIQIKELGFSTCSSPNLVAGRNTRHGSWLQPCAIDVARP
jgi:hypothetical protein